MASPSVGAVYNYSNPPGPAPDTLVEGQQAVNINNMNMEDQFHLLNSNSTRPNPNPTLGQCWQPQDQEASLHHLPPFPRRGLSRSEPSLTQYRAAEEEQVQVATDNSSNAAGEGGEVLGTLQFDNPVYALPNANPLSRPQIQQERSDVKRVSVHYENMKIGLDCVPPVPGMGEHPVRRLEDSWQEFEDSLGRRYFYHSQTNLSSWKPPRKAMNTVNHGNWVEADCVTDCDWQSKSKVNGTRTNAHGNGNGDISRRQPEKESQPAELERRPSVGDVIPASQAVEGGVAGAIEGRSVNFMPRLNRYSSLIEKQQQLGLDERGLLDWSEKENDEEERQRERRTATLPLGPRRVAPSKNFLELRQRIADKVQVPERGSPNPTRFRSLLTITEMHMVDLEQVKSAKAIPNTLLGKTWSTENKSGLQGFLNVTRYGKKLKKQWLASFVVLTDTSLFIFRVPFVIGQIAEIFVDLSGATIKWSKEKSHRKNVFEICGGDGGQVLVQVEDKKVADQWVNNIVQTITSASSGAFSEEQPLSSPIKVLPSPVEERHLLLSKNADRPMSPRLARLLGRPKSIKTDAEVEVETLSMASLPLPAVSGHKKKKSLDEMENSDIKIKKIKIIERLKNFFTRRPTLESLKAKGIIRDGPVFGCNFLKLCEQERSNVPSFVRRCVAAIEKKDLKTDGIYRVSGNLSQVQKLRFQIAQEKYVGMETEEDVNVLTGLLKLFFRELKEPMIPFQLYDLLMKANKIQEKAVKERRFRELVGQIGVANWETLSFLFSHLYNVAKFGDHNRMSLPNLAIVFGPTLMWPETASTNLAMDMLSQNQVVEYLLVNFHGLFHHS